MHWKISVVRATWCGPGLQRRWRGFCKISFYLISVHPFFTFYFLQNSHWSSLHFNLYIKQNRCLKLILISFHSFCTITWSSWIMGIRQNGWLRSLSISNVCKIPGDVQCIGHQSKWLTLVNFTFLPLILLEKGIQAKSFSLGTIAFTFYILQVIPNHVVCVFFEHAVPLNCKLFLVQSSKNRFPGICCTKPTKRRRAPSTTPSKLEAGIRSFSYKYKPMNGKQFSLSI